MWKNKGESSTKEKVKNKKEGLNSTFFFFNFIYFSFSFLKIEKFFVRIIFHFCLCFSLSTIQKNLKLVSFGDQFKALICMYQCQLVGRSTLIQACVCMVIINKLSVKQIRNGSCDYQV